MRKYIFCLAVLIAGCKSPSGPAGPAGSNGDPGDTFPALQTTFKTGESPTASYDGMVLMNIDLSSASIPITDLGVVNMAQTSVPTGHPSRILIRFEVSQSIPKNAVITNVVLQLASLFSTDITGADSVTIGAYDLTTPTLVDATTPAPCIWTGLVSWLYYDGANSWTDCGGVNSAIGDGFSKGTQFPSTPMSQAIISTDAYGRRYLWAFKITPSTVQKWIDTPAKNNGIMIMSTNEYSEVASGSIVFGTLASPVESRPTLIVTYYIP